MNSHHFFQLNDRLVSVSDQGNPCILHVFFPLLLGLPISFASTAFWPVFNEWNGLTACMIQTIHSSFCSYLRFSFQFPCVQLEEQKVKHAYDHSILLFGTTPRALYTDFVISAPTPYFHSAPHKLEAARPAFWLPGHAFAAWTLWPARFACLSESKPWGTLANVPEVQSTQSPALLCSCSSDLHCLWARASEHHLGIRRHGKQYHVCN